MGADLVLSALPDCKLTKARLQVLDEMIDKLATADFCDAGTLEDEYEATRSLYSEDLEPAALTAAALEHRKSLLKNHLRDYPEECRDIVSWQLHGCPIPYLITGGSTWGDDPTADYPAFKLFGNAWPIWEQLYKFALEDAQATKNRTQPNG